MKTIIEMAREADIDWHRHWNDDESNRLERFAELVAAAELERIIKVIESMGTWAHINEVIDEVRKNT
jgi:hypothetical protein